MSNDHDSLLDACRKLLAQWDHKTQRDQQHLGPCIAEVRKAVEAHDEQINADTRERFLQRQKEQAHAQ